MKHLNLGVLLTGVILVSGCTGLNVAKNERSLTVNINQQKGKAMHATDAQQEAVIRLIQETIDAVQNKMIIGNDTQLMGKNHDRKNVALKDKGHESYLFTYGEPKTETRTSDISVILYTSKNSQGQYETRSADVSISSGAYKTNFPYDIFLNRLGLIRYPGFRDRGIRPSVSFPNAMYGHWMHGDIYFVYPYQTIGHPEIVVETIIIESGNGGDINKQTVWGDINMDHPLNIQSINVYAK